MPIYEYHCEGCGSDFELLVNASTTPACPQCGNADLQKKFSAFATHSEGSGRSSSAAASHSHGAGCGCCRGPAGSCGLN